MRARLTQRSTPKALHRASRPRISSTFIGTERHIAFGLPSNGCNVRLSPYFLRAMGKIKDSILVLGVGNTLLSDEGVGVRAIEALDERTETRALKLSLIDGGTIGLSLLVEMEDAGAMIVIDAGRIGAAPGTVRTFLGANMDDFLRNRGRNPHDISLDDLMDGLRLRDAIPERRALVVVEPESLAVGDILTPAVAAAVPAVVDSVIAIAADWRRSGPVS